MQFDMNKSKSKKGASVTLSYCILYFLMHLLPWMITVKVCPPYHHFVTNWKFAPGVNNARFTSERSLVLSLQNPLFRKKINKDYSRFTETEQFLNMFYNNVSYLQVEANPGFLNTSHFLWLLYYYLLVNTSKVITSWLHYCFIIMMFF